MAVENDVKKAHMVSKGYLRAWADKRNVVDVLDLQDGRGFPSSLVGATVVTRAYDPNVLTRNLERDYWQIEDAGTPVIVKMRKGVPLTTAEAHAVIAFLDMHLDRGRYAHRTKVRAPALVLRTDGRIEQTELTLGDALLLSQSFQDVLRLTRLGLEHWPWHVREETGLATGDGAVLLWRTKGSAEITTVSFPLSPTQLLVIGKDLPDDAPLNGRLEENSNRWIVGEKGSLEYGRAAIIKATRTQE